LAARPTGVDQRALLASQNVRLHGLLRSDSNELSIHAHAVVRFGEVGLEVRFGKPLMAGVWRSEHGVPAGTEGAANASSTATTDHGAVAQAQSTAVGSSGRDAIAARKSRRACRVDEGRVEKGER
jgi:hypothetical protein